MAHNFSYVNLMDFNRLKVKSLFEYYMLCVIWHLFKILLLIYQLSLVKLLTAPLVKSGDAIICIQLPPFFQYMRLFSSELKLWHNIDIHLCKKKMAQLIIKIKKCRYPFSMLNSMYVHLDYFNLITIIYALNISTVLIYALLKTSNM